MFSTLSMPVACSRPMNAVFGEIASAVRIGIGSGLVASSFVAQYGPLYRGSRNWKQPVFGFGVESFRPILPFSIAAARVVSLNVEPAPNESLTSAGRFVVVSPADV